MRPAQAAGDGEQGDSDARSRGQQQIEAANQASVKAWQDRDTAAATRSYAPDAVVMQPNEAAWVGAEKIHSGMAKFISAVQLKDVKIKTEDVMVAGDLAIETGTYDWTFVPATGKPVHDQGKYLTAWKQQADGSWKIVRDINNSDLPVK